jgi:hypothetical protein
LAWAVEAVPATTSPHARTASINNFLMTHPLYLKPILEFFAIDGTVPRRGEGQAFTNNDRDAASVPNFRGLSVSSQ